MAHYVFAGRLLGGHGGGIGTRVAGTVAALAGEHRVTLVTSDRQAEFVADRYAHTPDVRVIAVPEPDPDALGGFTCVEHLWSMRLYRALRAVCAADPPELVQFSDFEGEAAVAIQARRTGDPLFEQTTVAVWLSTSWEIADVLDGKLPDDFKRRAAYSLERYSLAYADCLVHAGAAVRETYESFYGADRLARFVEYPASVPTIAPGDTQCPSAPGDPLRLLYLGRFERRKGVLDLVRALAFSPVEGWTLTLAGDDTPSGSLGASIRAQLEGAAADDPRISIRDGVPHAQVAELIDAHDAVISPSVWESGPNTALEALARNRPVLATPVGGHHRIVVEGVSGMLAEATGVPALEALVARAAARRDELRALSAAGAPRRRFDELTARDRLAAQFSAAADAGRREPARPQPQPLVSVILPYHRTHKYVEAAVDSVRAQSYPNIEMLLIRDGSFFPEDDVLDEIAASGDVRVLSKLNEGVGAVRNFGVLHTDGELLMFLDTDNTLHPEFIARAVHALRTEPEAAYVTSNLRLMNSEGGELRSGGVAPMISNFPELSEVTNVSGDAMSMIRREVFEAGFRYDEEIAGHEDWIFLQSLRHAGRFGHAIPEPLLNYRVRDESMTRLFIFDGSVNLLDEAAARAAAQETTWV